MAKSRGKLLFYGIIFIVLFLGLIQIFMQSWGLFIRLELFGLAFLMLLTFFGFVGYKTWGEKSFFFVFMFYLLNLLIVWYFRGSLHLTLLVLSGIGFLVSIPKRESCCCPPPKKPILDLEDEEKSVVLNEPEEKVAGDKEVKKTTIEGVKKATVDKEIKKAAHSPGKYVASSRSNIYHEPKCDWAKKINQEGRIWFADKKEALDKGYRGHNCVK